MKELRKQKDQTASEINDPNKGKRKPKIDLSKFRLGANWKRNQLSEED